MYYYVGNVNIMKGDAQGIYIFVKMSFIIFKKMHERAGKEKYSGLQYSAIGK